jgi:hypothetical protein
MLVSKTGYEPQLRLEAFYTGGAPARITRDGQRLVCPCADEVKASAPRPESDGGAAQTSRPVSQKLTPHILSITTTNTHTQIVDLASGMVERTLAGVSSSERFRRRRRARKASRPSRLAAARRSFLTFSPPPKTN